MASKKRKRRKIMRDITQLCDTVRETAFSIHKYHKHGHLEKVYENALTHGLRKIGLDAKQEHPLTRIFRTLIAGSGDAAYRDWAGGVVGRVPSRGGAARMQAVWDPSRMLA